MLKKIKGKPSWYKLWALSTTFLAFLLMARIVLAWVSGISVSEMLTSYDYLMMAFVNLSILLDMYFFPEDEKEPLERSPEELKSE
jgi:hypothetical protein